MSPHLRKIRHRKARPVPRSWQAGPPPAPGPGPPDAWKKPPRPGQCRRGKGQWCLPGPWGPRHFRGPTAFHGNEDRRWGPHDGPPPPPLDNRDEQGPEDGFNEPGPWDASPFPGPADFCGAEDRRWGPHDGPPPPHPWDRGGHEQGLEDGFREPGPWGPRPFPGPASFHGNEEDRTWGPPGCPPPPPWDDNQGPEDFFREGWFPESPLPDPDCFAMPDFTKDEQHPPWAPASLPGERGGFQDGYPAWGYRGVGRKRSQRFRRSCRELTLIHPDADLIQHLPCPQPSRGNQPPSRSSSLRGKSQPKVKEEPQDCDPPQPLISLKDDAQSGEQTAQDPVVVRTKVLEPPELASSPPKGPAADPQAATEAVELEQAAGEMLVEPAAEQKPADNHGQSPSVLETKPALPEESSAGAEEHPEAAGSRPQLCSVLPKPSPEGNDPRSTAILAKKEEIEMSYQQFSLTMAMVATLLLQKEPSMEASLTLMLRATLRQAWTHYLRELEDFINSYDSATLTH